MRLMGVAFPKPPQKPVDPNLVLVQRWESLVHLREESYVPLGPQGEPGRERRGAKARSNGGGVKELLQVFIPRSEDGRVPFKGF